MKIIGITGGVGAGKSTILHMLKELCNCEIIMADDVAKSIMKKGSEISDIAIKLFGPDAYYEDGNLNTKYISVKMYDDSELKDIWISHVHPATNNAIRNTIKSIYNQSKVDFIFVEAALLIENRYDAICDELWYVYADEKMRTERLVNDRGYSEDKSRTIMENQMTEGAFREHCSYVINTTGTYENTRQQLQNKLAEYA